MAKNTELNMRLDKDDRIRKPIKHESKFYTLSKKPKRYTHLEYLEFLRAYLIYDLSYPDIVREYHLYPTTAVKLSADCNKYMIWILTLINDRQKSGEKLKDICIDLSIEKKLYKAMIKYIMPKPKYTNPLYLSGCKDLDIFPIFDDFARYYRPVPDEWKEKYYGKK